MAPAAVHRRRSSSLPPRPTFFPALVSLLVLSFLPLNTSDIVSEREALTAFKLAVTKKSLTSWSTSNFSSSYCSWKGVECSFGAVSELHLPNSGLSGPIPLGVFGNLTKLITISLRFNNLSGPIPADIAASTGLRILNLEGNAFSGDIPESLLTLKNFTGLNLAGNVLSGGIPEGLSGLNKLQKLNLARNRLVGSIPNLDLPKLVQFNVSGNLLSGPIPPKLQKWPQSSFSGMPQVCGPPFSPCVVPSPSPTPPPNNGGGGKGSNQEKKNDHKKLSGGKIAGIVVGCIIGVLLLVVLVFLLLRRWRVADGSTTSEAEAGKRGVEGGRERGLPPGTFNSVFAPSATVGAGAAARGGQTAAGGGGQSKKLVFVRWDEKKGEGFDLEDLLRASAEVLGKGTFATTYRAWLESGVGVAVKRVKDVDVSESEFQETVAVYGDIDHPNVMALMAYYYSKDEKLLVYDYVPGGSLSALLHGNRGSGRNPINWDARLAIASDVAQGLEYIHSRGPSTSHGNIKSSNVLLSKSTCISDSGLVWVAKPAATAARNAGYRAPEVTDMRKGSQKADVYSFGVLLLELLTGKAPAQVPVDDDALDLPRWVRGIAREEWANEVFDLELLRYGDIDEEMSRLMQVALDCAAISPKVRPTMSEVVRRIDEIGATAADPPNDPAEIEGQSPRVDTAKDKPAGDDAPAPLFVI